MSQNRQCLDFILVRSGQLNVKEIGVLQYIISFSEFCAPPSLKVMAGNMQMGERTLRRILNSLVLKGMITKSYRCFKRLKLCVVSLENQVKLRGPGMAIKVIRKSLKKLTKSSDRPNHTGCLRPNLTGLNTEQKKEEQNTSIDSIDSRCRGGEGIISDLLSGFWEKRNLAKI